MLGFVGMSAFQQGESRALAMDRDGTIVQMLHEFDDTMIDKDKIYENEEDGKNAGKRKRELYQEGGPMAEVLEERLASGRVKPSKGCAVM